jgi:hypothetical protein
VEMCPATGVLQAIGYEQTEGRELPEPMTVIRASTKAN